MRRKKFKSFFAGDMCGAKNTAHGRVCATIANSGSQLGANPEVQSLSVKNEFLTDYFHPRKQFWLSTSA